MTRNSSELASTAAEDASQNPGHGLPSATDAPVPPTFFLNYRHSDTGWAAWTLYFKLEERFGSERVFFDNGTLRGGMEWFKEIKLSLAGVGLFIALIGPKWMEKLVAHLQSGAPDYVVKEIDIALRGSPHIAVIPVLVDDAHAPDRNDLPPALKALPGLHVERLRQTHAGVDIERLIECLVERGERLGDQ